MTSTHTVSAVNPQVGTPTFRLDDKKVSSNIVEGRVRLVHGTGVLLRGQLGYRGVDSGTLIDDYLSAAGDTAFGASVNGVHRISRTESPLTGNSLGYLNADGISRGGIS